MTKIDEGKRSIHSVYNETHKEAEIITEYGYQTLRNAKYVAGNVELSRRRDNLSWAHHLDVASLPPDQQDYWLDRAGREGFSRDELRRAVRQAKQIESFKNMSNQIPNLYNADFRQVNYLATVKAS